MDLYLIGKQHIDRAMLEQFRESPEPERPDERKDPRDGIVTTLRLRLSADLRALANRLEPGSLTPEPGTSHR